MSLTIVGVIIVLISILVIFAVYGIYRRRGQGDSETGLAPVRTAASTPILIGEEDEAWGEIDLYQWSEAQTCEKLDLDRETLNTFGGWLQQAPGLALNSQYLTTATYVIKVSPEAAAGIKSGAYEFMQAKDGGKRAIVLGKGKKIIEQGSLHPAKTLKAAAAITAVWQVLAMVTAQKFLADINRQLAELNEQVERIRDFLEQQHYGSLINNLAYVNQLKETIEQQRLTEAEITPFLNQLEQIDRDCGELLVVTRLEMEGERQMQSIVLPAMHQISKAVYVEQPITTKRRGRGVGTGYVDYWVYYE